MTPILDSSSTQHVNSCMCLHTDAEEQCGDV